MNLMVFYRLGRFLKKYHIPLLPRLCEGLIFLLFNSSVPLKSTIGKGTIFGHRGIGVVINQRAIIGQDCLIRPHVVIGGGGAPLRGASDRKQC
jgi:serine O-acetyltransferase